MTEHYVTLFDSLFLPQGLALHRSLLRHAGDFRLWVIAMDARSYEILTALDLLHVSVIPLSDVETDALRSVKAERSIAEYCWTLTPFTPDAVFERAPTADRATYVDADMWLIGNPSPVFQEMEEADAESLITPHAYSPRYASNLKYGIYCVQFLPFTRQGSREIRSQWQKQCIEWCFATPDATRFGDQKYLDSWPTDFPQEVHVLDRPQLTQAPWNVARFKSREAVTFHFHRLRLKTPQRAELGLYAIPRRYIQDIYRPYLADIRAALDRMTALGFTFTPQIQTRPPIEELRHRLEFRAHNLGHPRARFSLKF